MPVANCTDEDVGYETEGPKGTGEKFVRVWNRIRQWITQNNITSRLCTQAFVDKVCLIYEMQHTLKPGEFSFRPLIFKNGHQVKFHEKKNPQAEIAIIDIGDKKCRITYKAKRDTTARRAVKFKYKFGWISLRGNGEDGFSVEVMTGF